MIIAGTTSEIHTSSGDWLILDVGFANNKKSCGLLINESLPEELRFAEAVQRIHEYINAKETPVNLLIEAPLSVAFDIKGNPKGRSMEKQGNRTRYWYVGLGCAVMVAAMYLVKTLSDSRPDNEVRLFEGFVSFKKTDCRSSHSRDIQLLREVVERPSDFKTSIIDPTQIKAMESDMLQSAFLVAGVDAGIPPIIMRNG